MDYKKLSAALRVCGGDEPGCEVCFECPYHKRCNQLQIDAADAIDFLHDTLADIFAAFGEALGEANDGESN